MKEETIIKHRKTGKTERMINYVIDQLFMTGEVVIAEHSQFDSNRCDTKLNSAINERFSKRVLERLKLNLPHLNGDIPLEVEYKNSYVRVDKPINYIYFKLDLD